MRISSDIMSDTVTVYHRPSAEVDEWETTVLTDCAWQPRQQSSADADGTITFANYVRVQIPSDLGAVEVSVGDYIALGERAECSTTTEVMAEVEDTEHMRVSTVDDHRSALEGVEGLPYLRYAASLIVEGA